MIRDHFLPSLLGIPACEIDGDYRTLLSHSVRMGGLAVRNPLETAEYVHDTSKMMNRHLVLSLVEDNTPFDPSEHRRTVSLASVGARKEQLIRERLVINDRGVLDDTNKRKIQEHVRQDSGSLSTPAISTAYSYPPTSGGTM